MKKIILSLTMVAAVTLYSCDVLTDVAGDVMTDGGGVSNALTNADVISGLKEALMVGIKNGANKASITDGFMNNAKIKLPFPPEAQMVKEKALQLGLDGQVSKFELTLNRAAEEAAKEAAPIFVNAIKNMSVSDGFAILNGSDNAATAFLKKNTTTALVSAFAPKVDAAISKVNLTKYWTPLTKAYNTSNLLTGKPNVDTDLNRYVTERAITGLFSLVEEEEKSIRKDPAARVNDILKKVFSSLD